MATRKPSSKAPLAHRFASIPFDEARIEHGRRGPTYVVVDAYATHYFASAREANEMFAGAFDARTPTPTTNRGTTMVTTVVVVAVVLLKVWLLIWLTK